MGKKKPSANPSHEIDVRDLMQRLLPGAEHYLSAPPSSWKAWSRPAHPEPIDDAVAVLINKKRAPRVRQHDSLEESGIFCPFWYARAGVVCSIETANSAMKASELRQNHRGTRKK